MNKIFAAALLTLAAFAPATASAQPVTLKLAFFASDTEVNYAKAIKLWADAVNAEQTGGTLDSLGRVGHRESVMVDYSTSEFGRLLVGAMQVLRSRPHASKI